MNHWRGLPVAIQSPIARRRCKCALVPNIDFDDRIAARYVTTNAHMFDPAAVGPVIDFLADLAAGGAALELGIGTGRIALPVSGTGCPRARDRRLTGHGRTAAGETRR